MSARKTGMRQVRTIAIAFLVSLVFSLGPGLLGLGGASIRVSSAPAAASAGPNFAGTAASAAWGTPLNATGPNDNTCAVSLFSGSIDLTNFSFSIPAGSAITGIRVEPKASLDSSIGLSAQLLKGGVATGTAKTFVPPDLGCAGSIFSSLGGTGDQWGTTFTPSNINVANFGVRITQGGFSNLDAVRITVFYDPPPPAEVPEADTLLLMSGGLGGLATWVGWQRRKLGAMKK